MNEYDVSGIIECVESAHAVIGSSTSSRVPFMQHVIGCLFLFLLNTMTASNLSF